VTGFLFGRPCARFSLERNGSEWVKERGGLPTKESVSAHASAESKGRIGIACPALSCAVTKTTTAQKIAKALHVDVVR